MAAVQYRSRVLVARLGPAGTDLRNAREGGRFALKFFIIAAA
jgi:hypothetical protein